MRHSLIYWPEQSSRSYSIWYTVDRPNSHIIARPKRWWLFEYVWLFGYFVTTWVPGGFRIKDIDSSIRIRFLFINYNSKNYFLIEKTAFVIYEIFVNRELMPIKKKWVRLKLLILLISFAYPNSHILIVWLFGGLFATSRKQ